MPMNPAAGALITFFHVHEYVAPDLPHECADALIALEFRLDMLAMAKVKNAWCVASLGPS